MKNQFVSYELSLKLKELGYNEPFKLIDITAYYIDGTFSTCNNEYITMCSDREFILAPLYQQAISFLSKKLDFYYPNLQFQVFSDESGAWYVSKDAFTNNPEVDVLFNNLEDAIEFGINLLP